MSHERVAGILLHPTSLPGRWGIGDVGPAACQFVDFLAAAGQRRWQILPMGPAGPGNSPYSAWSTFAGNPLLISPERLMEAGLLEPCDLAPPPAGPVARIDYPAVRESKWRMLRRAHEHYLREPSAQIETAYSAFCGEQSGWLDDFALFVALKRHFGDVPWWKWEPDLRDRSGDALARWRKVLDVEVELIRFAQFLFWSQWDVVRRHAQERGVKVIGDLPIFVPHDSVDVWVNRGLFKLGSSGRPTVVAGVPPDYFSATGQLWGNPLYDWQAHAADGFRWWIGRIRAALAHADFVRLDHFRGFSASWEIPADSTDATRGAWVQGPGKALFQAVHDALGPTHELPLIAEDLGMITDDVITLRDAVGIPGMAVLQFAFDSDMDNPHLPHRHRENQLVYTGTHDNDTTRGWFASLDPKRRRFAREYLHSDGRDIHIDLMRLALSSVARTAIYPLQDVLGLGSEARMNTPGKANGNWEWRVQEGVLEDAVAGRLEGMARKYGR